MKILVLNENQKKSESIAKEIDDYKERISDLKSNSELIFDYFFQIIKDLEKAIQLNNLDSKIKLKSNSISIKSDGLELQGKYPKEITIIINGKNYTFKTKLSAETIADLILDKIVENPESLKDKISTYLSLKSGLSLCIDRYFSQLKSIIGYLKEIAKLEKKHSDQVIKEKKEEDKKKEQSIAFRSSLPPCLIDLMDKLTKEKDTYDYKVKKFLIQKYKELGKDAFFKQYGHSGYNVAIIDFSDEYIHENNVIDSEILVRQLMAKTKPVTGNIVKLIGITIAPGNSGITLNGRVVGEKGQCDIESIYAGGYNIQKEHIRVILKNKKKF